MGAKMISLVTPTIGPSEGDRMRLAKHRGTQIDNEFRETCIRIGLDPEHALATSPLLAIATRRAMIHYRHGNG
jgi:hypothetical protein